MISFEIPGALPTMNEIIAVSKIRYGKYADMKRKYTQLVKKNAEGLPTIESANFHITWYSKDKRKDPDNIASGIKFLLDGLVEAGVLPNDGWNEVKSISHSFQVDKTNPRVEVEIFEVKDGTELDGTDAAPGNKKIV